MEKGLKNFHRCGMYGRILNLNSTNKKTKINILGNSMNSSSWKHFFLCSAGTCCEYIWFVNPYIATARHWAKNLTYKKKIGSF